MHFSSPAKLNLRLIKNSYAFSLDNGMYSIRLTVVDNSAPIVKYKPFDSPSYIPYEEYYSQDNILKEISQNRLRFFSSLEPFSYNETTQDGKYTFGLENAKGERAELHVIVKDHLVYYAYDNEDDISLVTSLSANKINEMEKFVIPEKVDNRTLRTIGNFYNTAFDGTSSFNCKEVYIPESVNIIYSFMVSQRTNINIYVLNKNCVFVRPERTFLAFGYNTVLTCYGKANSTLKAMIEKRSHNNAYIFKEIT